MTPTLVAVAKIIIAIVGIYVVCKLETYLESKLSETSGNRTDLLILSSVIIVVALAIFIGWQSWALLKPVIYDMFKIPT